MGNKFSPWTKMKKPVTEQKYDDLKNMTTEEKLNFLAHREQVVNDSRQMKRSTKESAMEPGEDREYGKLDRAAYDTFQNFDGPKRNTPEEATELANRFKAKVKDSYLKRQMEKK